MKGCSQMRLS